MSTQFLNAFCQALNAVKRSSLSTVQAEQYLGGDLGIDSIEMLEIWFRIETSLGMQIADTAKRDIYTVGEVLDVLERHVPATSA
ncbi:acyl carrier protein [Oxalobacteraceae bacterium GrIS 1.11]